MPDCRPKERQVTGWCNLRAYTGHLLEDITEVTLVNEAKLKRNFDQRFRRSGQLPLRRLDAETVHVGPRLSAHALLEHPIEVILANTHCGSKQVKTKPASIVVVKKL